MVLPFRQQPVVQRNEKAKESKRCDGGKINLRNIFRDQLDDFGELKQSIHIYVYESSGSPGKDTAESIWPPTTDTIDAEAPLA